MEKTYDIQKAVKAQEEYLKRLAVEHPEDWMADNFAKGQGFAPRNGVCWCCHKNIYGDGGISVEQASSELTTGCPFCHMSFVD